MKRIIIALLLSLCAAPAVAQTALPRETRLVSQEVSGLIVYTTATSSAACTEGVHGCILSQTFASVTSATYTSFADVPYGARVQITYFDSGSNGTLVCTSATLRGIDNFGRSVSETFTSVGESGQVSTNAYLKISYLAISGCSGGGSSDVVKVVLRPSEIALPVRVGSTADLLGVAYRTSTGYWHTNSTGASRASANASVITLGATPLEGYSVRISASGKY